MPDGKCMQKLNIFILLGEYQIMKLNYESNISKIELSWDISLSLSRFWCVVSEIAFYITWSTVGDIMCIERNKAEKVTV